MKLINPFIENKNKKSLFIVFIVSFCLLFFHFTHPKYSYSNYTTEFNWDILSYYLYLPLTFLHHDLGIKDYSYIQHLFDQYRFSPGFYQAAQAENGNYVMIYTMGLAILESPFFLIGHLWAKLGGYPMDGFSYPYQFCVSAGMMIYLVLGVFILRKILLRFFNDGVTTITLILLLLGTNYFREVVDYNLGPHGILFTLYCLLIYYTIKWHEQPKIKYAAIVGIAVGFLTLSRPTEIICILIPLLWGIYNKESFFDKIALIKKNRKQVLILFGCVILVGLPQMIYWKTLTGHWLYNSYWNQISFDITESHFLNVFFSFRKGWFVYSPLVVLAFLGFFFLGKEKIRLVKWSLFAFIAINIFLICHVPIWWDAYSFGQRFMVQSYAILAIPLGAFIQFASERKLFVKVFVGTICFLLLSLNLFQTWQLIHGVIPGDGITAAFYKRTFLKTTPLTADDQSLLELQRSYDPNQKFIDKEGLYQGRTIGFFNMDSINTEYIDMSCVDTSYAHSGKSSFRLTPQSIYSPGVSIPYSSITTKDHAWIRLTVWYFPTCDMKDASADIVIHFTHRKKPYEYHGYHIQDNPYQLNKWNKYTVDYLTPATFSDTDELHAYIWFTGTKILYIDDIQIEAFEKK